MKDISGRLSTVNDLVAILNSATVDGVRHGDFERSHILRTAFVHAAAILDAFAGQPNTGFVDGHHFRLELLGQRHSVVDVVEMCVRNQNRIDAIELMTLGILGIAIYPRIHDDYLAGVQAKLERCVAEPRNLNHFYNPFVGVCAAGSWMPSPYLATPGIVTGKWPVMAISPNSAFTSASSELGVGLYVVMYVLTLGKDRTKYGLPSATRVTGVLPAINAFKKSGNAPANATFPR